MAKNQITLEGIIDTIRKKISKSIDNKLAKKIDSILDNPSRATLRKSAEFAKMLGLEVHAGHGLTYKSAKILAKISGIKEFNIGHFLIGESIFVGLSKTIKNFRKIVK